MIGIGKLHVGCVGDVGSDIGSAIFTTVISNSDSCSLVSDIWSLVSGQASSPPQVSTDRSSLFMIRKLHVLEMSKCRIGYRVD